MQYCGECQQIYDDGNFVSSGGGLCDYCFAIKGLGHSYDLGTHVVDLNQRRFTYQDEWIQHRYDFKLF